MMKRNKTAFIFYKKHIFCNIIYVFIVTFGKCNASFLNKNINFFKK